MNAHGYFNHVYQVKLEVDVNDYAEPDHVVKGGNLVITPHEPLHYTRMVFAKSAAKACQYVLGMIPEHDLDALRGIGVERMSLLADIVGYEDDMKNAIDFFKGRL